MKKILLTITVLLLMVSIGYCQGQSLKLTIKSNKQEYVVGEAIDCKVTIKNITNKEVKIYSPDCPGVSEITIINSQGIPMKPRGLKIERQYFEAFMTIPPDESRTHTFDNLQRFHCSGARKFIDEAQLKPDTYKIYVTVTNPPKLCGGKIFTD